jgi:hypothetical protein
MYSENLQCVSGSKYDVLMLENLITPRFVQFLKLPRLFVVVINDLDSKKGFVLFDAYRKTRKR